MAILEHPAAAPSTRIDEIWAAAQAQSDDQGGPSDESAGLFLDALLVEGLVCPVWSADQAPDGGAGEESSENFAPMTVERDGVETFYLFDSVERLQASGLDAEEFVASPGRLFFQLASEAGAQIAFNPGVADSDSLFGVETVEMVAALAAAAEEEVVVGAGQTVEILPPDPPTEALLAALAARLAAARGAGDPVVEAWLVTIRRIDAESGARADLTLAIGVAAGADSESDALGALARDLSRLGGHLSGGLDVALLEDGERALSAARQVGLGLLGGEPG